MVHLLLRLHLTEKVWVNRKVCSIKVSIIKKGIISEHPIEQALANVFYHRVHTGTHIHIDTVSI